MQIGEYYYEIINFLFWLLLLDTRLPFGVNTSFHFSIVQVSTTTAMAETLPSQSECQRPLAKHILKSLKDV